MMKDFTSPKDFLAVNRVRHDETADGWRLEACGVSVEIPRDLRTVRFMHKATWELKSNASSMLVAKDGRKIDISFSDAKSCCSSWEEFGAVGALGVFDVHGGGVCTVCPSRQARRRAPEADAGRNGAPCRT